MLANSIELTFPLDIYRFIRKMDSITLIYPREFPVVKAATTDHIFNIYCIGNKEYMERLKGGVVAPAEVLERKFFTIQYIRECKVVDITKNEWKRAFGLEGVDHLLSINGWEHPYHPIKVLSLVKMDPDLNELTALYGDLLSFNTNPDGVDEDE